jgi:hypothetical protein
VVADGFSEESELWELNREDSPIRLLLWVDLLGRKANSVGIMGSALAFGAGSSLGWTSGEVSSLEE